MLFASYVNSNNDRQDEESVRAPILAKYRSELAIGRRQKEMGEARAIFGESHGLRGSVEAADGRRED